MTAAAASRSSWYAGSDSVICGATVTESPVWTPIGSRFSIEQTITTLSFLSRITSSSNSSQPRIDSSTSTWPTGDSRSPASTWRRSSGSVSAKPPPWPPSVNAGRTTAGSEIPARSSGAVTILDLGRPQAAALHRLAELLAVLGSLDHVERRADQLDPERVEQPVARERAREVQRGLAAHRRQQRVGPLTAEHVRDALDVERLDVRAVGEARVGHDRRRVRVDDDRAEPVLAQDLERLRARVVELARLADHDRAGADQADRLEVTTPGRDAPLRSSC